MKLKKVTVSYDYVMVVDDNATDSDVYDVALDTAGDAFCDMSKMDMEICIVDYAKSDTSFGWDGTCIPYGDANDICTKDIV